MSEIEAAGAKIALDRARGLAFLHRFGAMISAGESFFGATPIARMIAAIDHVVLTTSDEERCIDFYTRVLGMTLERYGDNRIAFRFGAQKINVHPPGFHAGLRAQYPTPGSLDLCFLASVSLDLVIARLSECGIPLIAGPVVRAGAVCSIRSVYVRDPDQNLVEISEPER